MKLGQLVKDSALAGVIKGVRKTELDYNSLKKLNTIKIFNEFDTAEYDIIADKTSHQKSSFLDKLKISSKDLIKSAKNALKFGALGGKTGIIEEEDKKEDLSGLFLLSSSNKEDDGIVTLKLPQWGYEDFTNERNIWLKQITNKLNGPSLFYFKIFFDFNTNYGLFGGVLNSNYVPTNSALQYLSLWEHYYGTNYVKDRCTSLIQFTKLLSYISMYSPWFFKSVKNLQAASSPYTKEFGKEKSIDIELEEEAIDMRISTLFSLYKYACFDDINCREVIPENLRKFNMIIVLFESPIKYIHTPIVHDNYVDKKNYKSLFNSKSELSNMMSFKTYVFKNCEFSKETLNSYIKSDISNESGFNLGKNSIKIKYDRVYEYLSNEYMGLLIGSDSIYYYNENGILPTYNIYNDAKDNMINNSNVTTATESLIRDNIQTILKNNTNYALGNIFGEETKLYKSYPNKTIDKTNPTIAKKYFTEYTAHKMGMYTKSRFDLVNLGFDMLYKWLGADYKSGNISGINDVGTVLSGSTIEGGLRLGSASYNDKLLKLKNGPNGISIRNARMNLQSSAANLKYNVPKQIRDNALGVVKPLKI